MKTYLEAVIDQVEKKTSTKESKTHQIIQNSKEILEAPKFINQKGTRSLIDEDE